MAIWMATLTFHAKERLRERTKLSADELLVALRECRTVAFGANPGGRMQLHLLYSVPDDSFFVLPFDIAKCRVCTVLPIQVYLQQRRAVFISEQQAFDAKAKFVEPLQAIHPYSGQAVRVQAIGYFLDGRGRVGALNLGTYLCPAGITSLIDLSADEVFRESLLDRVRTKGLNPARLESAYVRQGSRSPVALPSIGPADPWATVGLFDVPGPTD